MNDEQQRATTEVDFRPFIIADADTGHGGDAQVRNLVRRFVEVGVPGYHIEDQKPGAKKCGHQSGNWLGADGCFPVTRLRRTTRGDLASPSALM